jgi:hypothetical protein
MIYTLLITSIILSILFYVYSQAVLSLSIEKSIVNTLGFLFLSMIIAYLVNKFWNIKDASAPTPEAPKSGDADDKPAYENLIPALRKQFEEADKLLKFSISTN